MRRIDHGFDLAAREIVDEAPDAAEAAAAQRDGRRRGSAPCGLRARASPRYRAGPRRAARAPRPRSSRQGRACASASLAPVEGADAISGEVRPRSSAAAHASYRFFRAAPGAARHVTMKPWLSLIGIGEDGAEALSPAARRLIAGAELVVGGKRHLALAGDLSGRGAGLALPAHRRFSGDPGAARAAGRRARLGRPLLSRRRRDAHARDRRRRR